MITSPTANTSAQASLAHSPQGRAQHGIARRALCTLVLVGALLEVSREAVAEWYGRRGSERDLRGAMRWDSGDPEFPARLAEIFAASSVPAERAELPPLLQKATRLGPDRADAWSSLASAFEDTGQTGLSSAAYQRALELFPKSPEINWNFANQLIRAGRLNDSRGPLRLAILGDSTLATGVVDLAWRAGLSAEQVGDIVPDRVDSLSAYLDYLLTAHRLDAAATVWTRLMSHAGPINLDAPWRYFDALLADHQTPRMTTVWMDLAAHLPRNFETQSVSANLINNGGFELESVNGGFDWRTSALAGANVRYTADVALSGKRALAVQFDGTVNADFGHVVQYVAVTPNTSYRFSAYVRTQDITTDSGPRLAVYDVFDHGAFYAETAGLTGTVNWIAREISFRTGARTHLIAVQVIRPPSNKLDNCISGTFWMDDVTLSASR